MVTKLRKKGSGRSPMDEKVAIQARVPRYVSDALDSYIYAFMRDNPGARLSKSGLAASLLIKHARESGALDDTAY
jgi:hypothetical protein